VNPRAPQYLAGRLLLAMPGMMDQRFDRAVIAMCIHDDQGAFGIGIGEARGISFHSLLEDVGIDPGLTPDVPVLHGGPVETGRVLFSIRPTGAARARSRSIRCTLSASLDVLRAIAEDAGLRAG
jgi:putative transcriptional regulator